MNIQDERVRLAEAIDAITGTGWEVSIETDPTIHTGLIHIGHAQTITLDSMGMLGFDLVINAWADESGDVDNARTMYTLLSGDTGSLLTFFSGGEFYSVSTVSALVEQRFKGTQDWLIGEFTVRLVYDLA